VGNGQSELAEMFVNFLVDEMFFGGRKYLLVEEIFSESLSLWNDPAVGFFEVVIVIRKMRFVASKTIA
jgi:hypothetical protein